MQKIEYYVDGDGKYTYKAKKGDVFDSEDDYCCLAEEIASEYAKSEVAYDYFPCEIEIIIDGKYVGVFLVEIDPEPVFRVYKK